MPEVARAQGALGQGALDQAETKTCHFQGVLSFHRVVGELIIFLLQHSLLPWLPGFAEQTVVMQRNHDSHSVVMLKD